MQEGYLVLKYRSKDEGGTGLGPMDLLQRRLAGQMRYFVFRGMFDWTLNKCLPIPSESQFLV